MRDDHIQVRIDTHFVPDCRFLQASRSGFDRCILLVNGLRQNSERRQIVLHQILLPVDFPHTSLHVIHQAATLAQHLHSEIVMLHVVTVQSHAAGVPEDGPEFAGWDMLAEIIGEAQKMQDPSLSRALEGLPVRCLLRKGKPAQAILETAQVEKADLIMMPSHGAMFDQFLLGSVTGKVLRGSDCPVWTDAHVGESVRPAKAYNPLFLHDGVDVGKTHRTQTVGYGSKQGQSGLEFAIHSVLCAVDLGPRSREAVSWAALFATEFGARLTLVHITPSVKLWGPGGSYVDQEWKKELVGDASQRIAKLQQGIGIKADILIGSGDVPLVLSEAARQTTADLLITGCYPYGGNLRLHGYPIICAVPIPVLSV